MLDQVFRLRENGTTARTEVIAGVTTFLTMSYSIFVSRHEHGHERHRKHHRSRAGRARDVRWVSWLVAALLLAYFVFVRSRI